MYLEEKYETIRYILYSTMFGCLLITIYPIAQYCCKIVGIPFDLCISTISIGFGNEVTLICSIIGIIIVHYTIKFFSTLLYKLVY